jgi:signal transduction histidine kinase
MRPGQLLEIEGVSAVGGFAPDIEPHQVRLLGEAPLPQPRSVSFEQMAAGQEDCNWVEFSGIVRSVGADPLTEVALKLAGGGGTVLVPIKDPELESCLRLIDAEVTVRGVCIAHFNREGQLIQVAVQISTMNDITIRKPAPTDPFALPTRKISNLLHYAPLESPGHRVKVQGVVTLQRPGQSLFIADETQGLYIQTAQADLVQAGDRVEALGFPSAGQYVAPILQDAIFRKIGTGPPPPGVSIAAADAQRDTNHAALVQIQARLVNRFERRHDLLLELQSGSVVFDADLEKSQSQASVLDRIPDNSKVLVTGVCLVAEDQDWLTSRSRSFSLLLRSPGDVILLERPSWWTVRHTLWVLAGTASVFCASLAWVAVLRRQVQAQTKIIAEKIQREAALEERTRIARDLHDDLGASLTRISFLSGFAQKGQHGPEEVREHLHEISDSSQEAFQALDEIVWVVNPKNDTLENLNNYICHFAAHFFRGTPTRCRFDLASNLPDCPLPTETRNNLFLAVKEALNNVRKHSGATEVVVRVRAGPASRQSPPRRDDGLSGSEGTRQSEDGGAASPGPDTASSYSICIEDNGRGFTQTDKHSLRNGLGNMRQRMETIGGKFELESGPGVGTKVHLYITV